MHAIYPGLRQPIIISIARATVLFRLISIYDPATRQAAGRTFRNTYHVYDGPPLGVETTTITIVFHCSTTLLENLQGRFPDSKVCHWYHFLVPSLVVRYYRCIQAINRHVRLLPAAIPTHILNPTFRLLSFARRNPLQRYQGILFMNIFRCHPSPGPLHCVAQGLHAMTRAGAHAGRKDLRNLR